MAVEASGTQTATLGSPATLAAPSTGKFRTLVVNLSNLADGETVALTTKAPVVSGGLDAIIKTFSLTGVQTEPNFQSPPLDMPYGGTFTLTQTGGTGRSYEWHISAWTLS